MGTFTLAAKSNSISLSGTGETTLVPADPNGRNHLQALVITTVNAAVGTLTLRSGTAGPTRMVIDYPNAASAPSTPFTIDFDPPLEQDTGKNNNWTIQASANASNYKVTATWVSDN